MATRASMDVFKAAMPAMVPAISDMPAFDGANTAYEEVSGLREEIAALREQLKCERHRADIVEFQLAALLSDRKEAHSHSQAHSRNANNSFSTANSRPQSSEPNFVTSGSALALGSGARSNASSPSRRMLLQHASAAAAGAGHDASGAATSASRAENGVAHGGAAAPGSADVHGSQPYPGALQLVPAQGSDGSSGKHMHPPSSGAAPLLSSEHARGSHSQGQTPLAGPSDALHHHQQPSHKAGSHSSSRGGSGTQPRLNEAHMAGSSAGLGSGDESELEELVSIPRGEFELLLLKNQALDVLQEGITIADAQMPDMPLIYANAGFARTTGYSLDYTLGNNCRFLQGEGTDDETVGDLRRAISEGRSCVVQLLNYKRSGDPFINLLSVTPIYDPSGRLTHYVGIQSDITELVNHKKAELAAKHAALLATAATEAKSQFLARMSHEIRTPLNGIISVGQLLAETQLTPAQWDLVNTIRCSGETLLALITDILDFSRIEANKMVLSATAFKLDSVVEAAVEIAGLRAGQKRLQVVYHMHKDTPPVVWADAQRLQQVLLNVLNNGVKFTERGELVLEVWPEFTPPPGAAQTQTQTPGQRQPAAGNASATAAGKMGAAAEAPSMPEAEASWPRCVVHFSVRDTGIGIAPDNVGRLFHSFSQVDASPTRRYGGSGLGLAISRKLCEAMGGTMWAESPGLGHGSTFRWNIACKVPAPPPAAAAADAAAAVGHAAGGGAVEVLVDASASGSACSSGEVTVPSDGATPPLPLALALAHGKEPVDAVAAAAEMGPTGLHGKRVLLLEPCNVVRQALALALESWGCGVCAVANEEEALSCLLPPVVPSLTPVDLKPRTFATASGWGTGSDSAGRSTGDTAGSSSSSGRPSGPYAGGAGGKGGLSTILDASSSTGVSSENGGAPHMSLSLDPAIYGEWEDARFKAPNPYDVVLLDLSASRVLDALLRADKREAARLVFLSWPGQQDVQQMESMGGAWGQPPAQPLPLPLPPAVACGAGGMAPMGNCGHAVDVLPSHMGSLPANGSSQFLDAMAASDGQAHCGPAGSLGAVGGAGAGAGAGADVHSSSGVPGGPPPVPSMDRLFGMDSAYQHTLMQDQEPLRPRLINVPPSPSLAMPWVSAGVHSPRLSSSQVNGFDPMALTQHQVTSYAQAATAAAAAAAATAAAAPFRQLGYVTVTRPVRQARLKAAIEEVLAMQLDPTPTYAQSQAQAQAQAHAHAHAAPQELMYYFGNGNDNGSTQGSMGGLMMPPGGMGMSMSSANGSAANLGLALGVPAGVGMGMGMGMHGYSTTGSPSPSATMSLTRGMGAEQHHQHQHQHQLQHQHQGSVGSLSATLKPASMKKSSSNTDLERAEAGLGGGAAGGPAACRILIAEDNAINMKVALGTLKRLGYTNTVTAENGQQALDIIVSEGGPDAFQLILMDLHMPIMGGLEVVGELGTRYPHRKCHVVAVTADAFEGTRDHCLAAGFDGWLTKPFRVEDVNRIMGSHSRPGEGKDSAPVRNRQLPHSRLSHTKLPTPPTTSSGAAALPAAATAAAGVAGAGPAEGVAASPAVPGATATGSGSSADPAPTPPA